MILLRYLITYLLKSNNVLQSFNDNVFTRYLLNFITKFYQNVLKIVTTLIKIRADLLRRLLIRLYPNHY